MLAIKAPLPQRGISDDAFFEIEVNAVRMCRPYRRCVWNLQFLRLKDY